MFSFVSQGAGITSVFSCIKFVEYKFAAGGTPCSYIHYLVTLDTVLKILAVNLVPPFYCLCQLDTVNLAEQRGAVSSVEQPVLLEFCLFQFLGKQ